MTDRVPIRFLAHVSPYTTGEVAGFAPHAAQSFVARGVAEYYRPPRAERAPRASAPATPAEPVTAETDDDYKIEHKGGRWFRVRAPDGTLVEDRLTRAQAEELVQKRQGEGEHAA